MTYGPGMGAGGGAQVPVVIRVGTVMKVGRTSSKLPAMAQVGDSPPMPLQVGDNPVPLPPGVWPVRAWSLYYGMKTGRAELTVDTRAGQPVLLHYMAPHTIYNRGVLSYQPVPRRGKSTLALIFLLALAVPLIIIIATLLSR